MKNYEPGQITLVPIPANIDIDRLQLNKNQCQDNAYKTTRNYDYIYVEGAVILVDKDGSSKTIAHAWNEGRGGHFDVTTQLWVGEEYDEISEMKYVPVIGYDAEEIPQGGIDFINETKEVVRYFNDMRDWKFQAGTEVVLNDPDTHKPVCFAVITDFDPETKNYGVIIQRLGNQIPFIWPEPDIEKSTPALKEQAENALAQLEMASDLCVSSQDIAGKKNTEFLVFDIDVPPYTVFYKQLSTDAGIKWRLVAMKSLAAKR